MTGLVEVFSAWFRTFGYSTRHDATVQGASGSHHQFPLLLEQDMRRIGVYTWTRLEVPTAGYFRSLASAAKDTGLDQGLLLTLAPIPDAELAQLHAAKIQVWGPRRIALELGEAVLAETCPDVWPRSDAFPLVRSRIVEEAATVAPPPPLPSESAMEPMAELPFPVAAPPALATPAQQQSPELVVPPAFAMFETPPEPAAAPTPAPTPAIETPRPAKAILRAQVSKGLALSLVRKKLRSVDRMLLRLTPFHVFDYEANLLVDGSLDAQSKKGRMAVDATVKKLMDWATPLEVGDIQSEGVDVDEKKVRIDSAQAEQALRSELVNLVTRDVVMEEDGDEWMVVTKKKVALSPNDIQLRHLGTFLLPVWRLSGKDGFVEIDATNGGVLNEEITVERADAQLI